MTPEEPLRAVANDPCLISANGDVIGLISERPGAAIRLTSQGKLRVLRLDAARLVIRFLARDRTKDPRVESSIVFAQVDVAGHGREEANSSAIADLEELLKFSRVAV